MPDSEAGARFTSVQDISDYFWGRDDGQEVPSIAQFGLLLEKEATEREQRGGEAGHARSMRVALESPEATLSYASSMALQFMEKDRTALAECRDDWDRARHLTGEGHAQAMLVAERYLRFIKTALQDEF